MIVNSMTHEEVYRELGRDREAMSVWWRHHLSGLRRPVLKSRVFPITHWQEYISARRIRYQFFSRIYDKRMHEILTGVFVPHRTANGTAVYTTWLYDQQSIAPMVILPHAWERYRERTGCGLTGMDLYRHYYMNNVHGSDSRNQKVVARSVRWLEVEHLSYCTPEGVMLGQVEQAGEAGKLFVAHTFITYDMACGLQAQEFDARKQEILSDREVFERAKLYYMRQL